MTDPANDDRQLLDAPPDLSFEGRAVWVTGASRGLGRTLAYALAGAGAEVLLSARSREPLERIAADIEAIGGTAHIAVGSVANPDDVAAAAAQAEAAWGRLDALVNNAGISPTFQRSEKMADDQLRTILETNLLGPVACTRAALPLLEATGGSVVNVSSVHGTSAQEGLLGYATSKGALEMATRTMSIEWAPRGVRVNSLAPGYIETDLTAGLRDHPRWSETLISKIPLGRFARTREIVSCAMFLASPISGYVTGATMFADGGWTAR